MDVSEPAELLRRVNALEAGRTLLARLQDHEPVYLVGGAVRDLLRGEQPRELDLVVEGDAVALARRLHGSQVVAHDRFGTSTVRLDGHTYDIASARRESYERPGALPTVAPAPLKEDLKRRDFTVNAIAMALGRSYERPGALPTVAPAPLKEDLKRRDFTVNAIAMALGSGRLEPYPGALEDLQARTLRVLHDRSFIDDPTRLLRLARYASRLGFAVEPRTRELALTAVRQRALETVSGARVGAELRLLAREPDPLAALEALHELELDSAIHSRFGVKDPEPVRRALKLLPPDGRRDLLALAAAAEEVPARELPELLDRLTFEAPERDRISTAATQARRVAERLASAEKPSEIVVVAAGAAPELVALAGGHGGADRAREWLDQLRHVSLEIDGRDLIEAGVPEGPAIGRALQAALEAKLDGRASGREAELAQALEAVR